MIFAPRQQTRHLELKRVAARRPPTFKHLHAEPTARGGNAQAQGRRRGFGSGTARTKKEGQPGTLSRCNLQAPYLAGVDARRPAQYRPRRAARQSLFGGPQGIARRSRRDDDKPRQIDTRVRPARCMHDVRRSDQDDPLPFGLHGGQRRQEQRAFALSGTVGQHLGQRPARPAAARQFAVERRKAAGHSGQRGTNQPIATPDIGTVQHLGKGNSVHS